MGTVFVCMAVPNDVLHYISEEEKAETFAALGKIALIGLSLFVLAILLIAIYWKLYYRGKRRELEKHHEHLEEVARKLEEKRRVEREKSQESIAEWLVQKEREQQERKQEYENSDRQ